MLRFVNVLLPGIGSIAFAVKSSPISGAGVGWAAACSVRKLFRVVRRTLEPELEAPPDGPAASTSLSAGFARFFAVPELSSSSSSAALRFPLFPELSGVVEPAPLTIAVSTRDSSLGEPWRGGSAESVS